MLTAKKLGITGGISDTQFGIAKNITRQDMAVMITRTIEKLNIKADLAETEDFVDASAVSDYAKDSVAYMKAIGLIEGFNNEFKPLDNLTRAEAAKIISGLLKIMEK